MISIGNAKEKKLNITVKVIFFILIYTFFILQYYKGELISDDLVYLSEKFTSFGDAFTYILHYGNGRLLGNILGIGLSYFLPFRLIFKAACSSLIVMLTPYVMGCDNLVSYALSFLAFGTVSDDMYRMTIEFNSAYANYCPPILAMLLCILLIKSYYGNGKNTPLIFALLFIVSLLGQLFVENSSILNICVPLIMIFALNYRRKSAKAFMPWLIGSTIGVWAMFMIPVVFEPSDDLVAQYRGFNLTSFSKFIRSLIDAVSEFIRWFGVSPVLMALIFTAILFLIIRSYLSNKKKMISLITVNSIGFAYFILKQYNIIPYYSLMKENYRFNYFINLSAVLMLLITSVTVIILIADNSNKIKPLSFIVVIFAAFAPLSIVFPLRISCFLHIYVILTGLCIGIIAKSDILKKHLSAKADIISLIIVLAFSVSKLSGLYIS